MLNRLNGSLEYSEYKVIKGICDYERMIGGRLMETRETITRSMFLKLYMMRDAQAFGYEVIATITLFDKP